MEKNCPLEMAKVLILSTLLKRFSVCMSITECQFFISEPPFYTVSGLVRNESVWRRTVQSGNVAFRGFNLVEIMFDLRKCIVHPR